MKHIVIIGNGIAGITAARHIRKRSDYEITVISGETDYFFSRTALMYVYMGHMKFEHTKPYENWFWKKNRINLVKDWVTDIDFKQKTLKYKSNEIIHYDDLVLAVGSKPNKFGWTGQDLKGVQGLYSYQDLQLMEENTAKKLVTSAVIVGGGLIGVEMAEMLLSRGIAVTFLIREGRFWGNVLPEEEGRLVERHMLQHHVDLQFNTELDEILSDSEGRVKSVRTRSGDEISCQFVGLTAGVSPNVEFLKTTGLSIQKGISVNAFLETNQSNVYAIGDCAENESPIEGRAPLEQVWYTGRMMGETVARTICEERTMYKPGIWFNSAKFFDIEYQTYGTVKSILQKGEKSFYWENDNGNFCIKIVFDEKSEIVKGTNVFGIRMRHEVWDRWLREKKSILYVLEHLKDANFDTEFYKKHEKDIVDKFNGENATSIVLKRRNWNRILGIG